MQPLALKDRFSTTSAMTGFDAFWKDNINEGQFIAKENLLNYFHTFPKLFQTNFGNNWCGVGKTRTEYGIELSSDYR